MKYNVQFTESASIDIARLKKSENFAYKKVQKLIEELKLHPRVGIGKPEELKYDLSGYWSRRITDRHRLIYKISDDVIVVLVVSAYGHYADR